MWTCLNPPRKTHEITALEEIGTAEAEEITVVAEIAEGEGIAGAAEMIVKVLEMTLICKVIAWK
jgi:hypothetical protein